MQLKFLFNPCLLLLLLSTSGILSAQSSQQERIQDYVLSRYIENMGGRAALEQIKSVRLRGTITYKDGQKHNITVLKKKPNLTRVVLDTGISRLIQAFDGEVAWYARESGKNISYSRMQENMAETFIREAPLENSLFHAASEEVEISLGEDVNIAMIECYQVIARFKDGSKNVYYLDKETFTEMRIFDYDRDGNLLSELVPGEFESYDGVMFAMQIIRLQDGKVASTLNFDELETNVGLLDTAFAPPVDLP